MNMIRTGGHEKIFVKKGNKTEVNKIGFLLFAVTVLSIMGGMIGPAAGAQDACRDSRRTIHYDVAAIDIAIPINGWGDINPQGMIYVLNNPQALPNVAQVRDTNFKLYDSTDESIPRKIQPLVLRANMGDCIEISLTNLLDTINETINPAIDLNTTIDSPTDPATLLPINALPFQRNVGMQIMGLPFDPEISYGGFVGNNPDTTAAPGATKTYRWYANRTGGFMFRDNSNIQFPQDTVVKGLFGMVVVEPPDSTWFDSVTGRHFLKANPQIGYNLSDLAQQGTDPITGKPMFLGVGASIFASIHQQPGAPLPRGALLWENVSGNDFRDYAIIMHDEFEGRISPVAWNEDGTIAAFGEEFFPPTGQKDDTFLMNYRSEPLRNRVGAWVRHRGQIPVPDAGLVNGLVNTTFTNRTLGVPFVDIPVPVQGGIEGATGIFTLNASNMTVILPNGRKFGPGDDFCDDGIFASDNARPGDINYTFYSCLGEEAHLQSWPFGDPAVALPRAYWGDPVILWVGNADSHDTHTFHLHAHRWFHDPDQADFNLLPVPENPIQVSNRLDVQGVGAGEVFKIVLEQGAGSQAGTAGDSIFHCHLYPHFGGGIWGAIRVFDKLRINFTDPANINSNLLTGEPLLYPDGTQEAVLVPLPAKMALFDTRVPGSADNRAPAPRGMPNRTAMPPDKDHPGYPNFVAGKFGLKALQPPRFILDPVNSTPIKDRATPTQLEINASYDGIRPGVTLVDPCKGPNGEFGANRKPDRIYEPVAIELPFIQNAKGGFFYTDHRAFVERESVAEVRRDPSLLKPYSWRANVGDCVEYYATNAFHLEDINPTFGVEDGVFHGIQNTPEVSNHIHIIRFDQLGSDGTSVNWNYDISARVGEKVGYRIFVDINGRTIFNHDHQFPTTHQQGGVFAALIVEPANASYFKPDGSPLGPTTASPITYDLTNKQYTLEQGKGVGVAANIVVDPVTSDTPGGISGGNVSAFREFVVHYSDFTPSFVANPAQLKAAFDELKTNPNSSAPFNPAFRTRPYNPPFVVDDYLPDQGTTALNYRVEPFQARLNLSDPNATAAMLEPAYIYSSVIHGDPETEVFRAYTGDPVVFRLMDSAHEEHHVFEVHGHRWQHQPADPNTFPTDNQASNIGEWFNYELIGNTMLNGESLKEDDALAAGLPGDYLFGATSTAELWNGMWGIFRVENGEKPGLAVLPGSPAPQEMPGLGLLPQVVDPSRPVPAVDDSLIRANSPCPAGAPVKHFDISAINKFTVYNSKFNENDPFALMYVLAEDEAAVLSGTKQPLPLVIRANAGDCIEVNLTNNLPDLTALAEAMQVILPDGTTSLSSIDPNTLQHFGDAQMNTIVEGLPGGPKFIFWKWPMSNRVSMHPHLLKEVASVGDGATVGYMRDQTVGPGQTITYQWYADMELGATLLDDYGDQRSHRHHGLFGALIIEPNGSIYFDPANLAREIKSGASAVIQNATTGEQFREFVPLFMDGLNLRKDNALIPDDEGVLAPGEVEHQPCSPENAICEDVEQSGDAGINYRTERLEDRVPFNPVNAHGGHPGETVFNPLTFTVFSSTTHGDPRTPVFEAFVGDPVVLRVLRPSDVEQIMAIGVDGHNWEHEHDDPGTNIVNVEGSIGVGKAFNFYLLGGAGGEQQQPGDYLYGTRNHVEPNTIQGGMWGLLRVHPAGAAANIQPLIRRAESLKVVTTKPPITKEPAQIAVLPGFNGIITGTVTDATSGTAIAGASVTAGNITATTDAGGSYNMSIAPGTYTVTASAAGYAGISATVTVTSGGTITLNFAPHLLPQGAVNGIIRGAVTNASSGTAVAGAVVTAGGITATTDASGNYEISIAPGTYTVTASANGYVGSSATMTVASGTTVTLNFALQPFTPGVVNSIITGTVIDASSGAAIAGASVTVGAVTATTGATGTYTISIAPGSYTVTAGAPGYTGSSAEVTVTSGVTVVQNFALRPLPAGVVNGIIRGTVTDALSGLSIAGASVTAGGIIAATDASGNYNISIAPGAYIVTVSASGYASSSTASDVVVVSGGTASVNFILQPLPAGVVNSIIRGTVTNASSGIPVAGASVTAGSITATADANGNYNINIVSGTYTLTVSASGYSSNRDTITVTSGATGILNFALQPGRIANPQVAVYDINNNGVIEKAEAVRAVLDFFSGVILKPQAVAVVMAFFSG